MLYNLSIFLLVLLLSPRYILGDDVENYLTSQNRKEIESVLNRLTFCAATDEEKALVNEIRLKCETLLFLRGTGVDCEKALAYLVEMRAIPVIVKGLNHFSIVQRIPTAKVLGELNEPSVVPDLVRALKESPSPPQGGSTNIVMIPLELRKALVEAIKKLTKQEFHIKNYESKEEIEKAVNAAEDWLAQQKGP